MVLPLKEGGECSVIKSAFLDRFRVEYILTRVIDVIYSNKRKYYPLKQGYPGNSWLHLGHRTIWHCAADWGQPLQLVIRE